MSAGVLNPRPPAGLRRLLFPESWPAEWRAAVLIVGATLAVYGGGLAAPLVEGGGVSADGPIPKFLAAVTLRWGGTDARVLHAVSLFLHLVATGLVFGILHRTLARSHRGSDAAGPFLTSLAGALLWGLHPVQTQIVMQTSQHGMLLAGGMIFLALYAFVRAVESPGSRRWAALAVLAAALGMATHPVAAAAPILVLLFDRTFFSGSFREAWRRHRGIYFFLAAAWLGLAWTVWTLAAGPTPWMRQARGVLVYLRLAFWPHPLVFDYGDSLDWPGAGAGLAIAALGAMGAAMAWALKRRPAFGFAATWFLVTLAAATVLSGRTGGFSETYLYVPLAAVMALLPMAAQAVAGRRAIFGVAVLVMIGGFLARQRVAVYQSALTLWSDTAAKAPANAQAQVAWGNALMAAGRPAEALERYREALQRSPEDAAARLNLAGGLLQLGRADEAVAEYEQGLRLKPDSAEAHLSLAAALVRLGRAPEAVAHYEAAMRLGVVAAAEERHFGRTLAEIGRLDDALAHLERAAQMDPADAETRMVLGMVLSAAGRPKEGLKHLVEAVLLRPDDAEARAALGEALVEDGRPAEALAHLEAALRLQPAKAAELHPSIGNALVRLGRATEAIEHYEAALRLNPDDAETRASLERVRAAAARYNAKKK